MKKLIVSTGCGVMKIDGKQIVNELIWIIGIFVFGAFLNTGMETGFNFPRMWENKAQLYINGSFWVVLWKGNEYLAILLDRTRLKWVDHPKLRFAVSLVSCIVYTLVATFMTYFVVFTIIFDFELGRLLQGLGFDDFLWPLIFTLFIATFFHGRGFLYSWRESAINVEKLQTQQMASRFEGLKNQVNPHFLFNSLNALSSLVYEDQKKAVEFIRKMSEVYRYVLDQQDKEIVAIEDELEFVKAFIYLQKIRFADNLTVNIEAYGTTGVYVPPLSLQMLIENAIKHNVISQKDPLIIDLKVENGHVLVQNNLQKKKASDTTGIGLKNLEARYGFLSDQPIEIREDPNRFIVKLPILKVS